MIDQRHLCFVTNNAIALSGLELMWRLDQWQRETLATDRDREKPRGAPLPHHPAYGSVQGGSLGEQSQPASE